MPTSLRQRGRGTDIIYGEMINDRLLIWKDVWVGRVSSSHSLNTRNTLGSLRVSLLAIESGHQIMPEFFWFEFPSQSFAWEKEVIHIFGIVFFSTLRYTNTFETNSL